MSEVHVLVDLQNVRPPAAHLETLAPGFSKAWVFHGAHEEKLSREFAAIGEHVTLVPISRPGKNALDFHLSFYLGYVAARHPDARLVVVANDKGYEPMIEHAVLLGFTVHREGYKEPPKTSAKKKAVTATKKSALKKKSPAPKKVAAKKVAAKKTAAASMAAPAKKKSAAKKTAPAKKTPKVAKPSSASPKGDLTALELQRVAKGIAKMSDKRPHKRASFLRHLGSMFGKDASGASIEQAAQHLQKSGVILIDANKVSYPVAAAKP